MVMLTINDFLYFGALAQLEFDMDAGTLTVELHPYPPSKYIELLQEYSDYNILRDRVEIVHFVDGKGKHMFMGYSRPFNTLIVCDDPKEKKHDGRILFETIETNEKRDIGIDGDGCTVQIVYASGASHLCCGNCGSHILTTIKDKYSD
jgi:hypothetical protein